MVRFSKAVGLDIGRHSAKIAVAVSQGAGFKVIQTEWVRLPARGGDVQALLSSFFRENGLSGLPVVAGLAGDLCLLRAQHTERGDAGSGRDVAAEEADRLGALGEVETITRVSRQRAPGYWLVGAARRDAVDRLVESIEEAGADPVNVMPEAVALHLVLSGAPSLKDTLFAAVDFGHQGTDVLIGRGDVLLFTRRFRRGARLFPEQLRREEEEDRPETVRVLQSGDVEDPDREPEALTEWLQELGQCFDLFRNGFPAEANTLSNIILCGAGSRIQGLPEQVEAFTGLEVQRIDQMGDISFKDPERYAVAAGLAGSAVSRRATGFSLLDFDRWEQVVLRRRKPFWLAASWMVPLCLLLLAALLRQNLARERDSVEALNKSLQQREAFLDEIQRLEKNIERMTNRIAPMHAALQNGIFFQEVVAEVAASCHPDDWVVLMADSHSYFTQEALAAGPPQTQLGSPGPDDPSDVLVFSRIVVEGYTPVDDFSTVLAMIGRLRESPYISAVDLLSDDNVRENVVRDELWGPTGCRLFALEITLVSGGGQS